MILAWLNGREAAEMGTALADEFAPPTESAVTRGPPQDNASGSVEHLMRRADSEVRPLQLNFYQKAKFANSFKWRLIENGVARGVANDVTHSLVLHLSQNQTSMLSQDSVNTPADPTDRAKAEKLFHRGNKCMAQADYAQAAALYGQVVELESSHAEALNNLGSSLAHLGRYDEAERYFRLAMTLKPNFSEPYANLGILLRQKSYLQDSETLLRRALKLRPNDLDARINLGLTLVFTGRLRDARACFAKVLKTAPRNVHALFGMGQIASVEGRFEEAETTYRRIIELNPKMTNALAALALTRKMTNADGEWLRSAEESAEELARSAIHPLEEATLRFAIGKYFDDVNDFARAFESFKRGNELLKTAAEDYDRKERSDSIDALIRVYSRQSILTIGAAGSSSAKPVFVVGMPRSGTSLVEQIIASHPAAHGAGELDFWGAVIAKDPGLTRAILAEPARPKVAAEYLRILERSSGSASRVVDKAPRNSDCLGLIYSVFPNARVIYMQRDPIDTCLSCYFQQFLTGINFAFDLSDLVHYYREHERLMAHWRAVLPPGFILDVPYEELVADQETWTRKMLDFIGLEWDARCLDFHANRRHVTTASAWQVRQKIYRSSVARWHNYEKFIGPLKTLGK
jgi:tetratricopeptide (TPR) repeat protein